MRRNTKTTSLTANIVSPCVFFLFQPNEYLSPKLKEQGSLEMTWFYIILVAMWCYIMVCDVNDTSLQNFIPVSSTLPQNILKRSTKHYVFKWSTKSGQSVWPYFFSSSFADARFICTVCIRVGSGDPVRVLHQIPQQIHWIQLKHLLLRLYTTCHYWI